MLKWFRPRCPVNTQHKAWLEWRFAWLMEKLGVERMRTATLVLPTDEFFPMRPEPTYEFADAVLSRLCQWMSVDRERVTLEIVPDDQLPGATGDYSGGAIRLSDKQLRMPPQLAATLAHELGHEILLGGGIIEGDLPDHEPLTDLLMVYLGLGIMSANATITETHSRASNFNYSSIARQGYLTSVELGYGLALFAHQRGDEIQGWKRHLRLDAWASLAQGRKYLEKTGDCYVLNELFGKGPTVKTPSLPAVDLRSRFSSQRLIGLYRLNELGETSLREMLPAVRALVRDRDEEVRVAAIESLATMRADDRETVELLADSLRTERIKQRNAAVTALGVLRVGSQHVVEELHDFLLQEESSLGMAVAGALARIGPPAAMTKDLVLRWLRRGLVECDAEMTDSFARALLAISTTPVQDVREYFIEIEAEYLLAALAAIEHLQEPPNA